jgi:uncharacterized protein (TIGR02453 family)
MFQGFTDQTVDFMWGIRFNNERGWFLDHKQEYLDFFYTPMRELANELYAWMAEKLPDLALECKVSRIYKDARRLHGSGPYRDHLWLSLQQPTEAYTTAPCFWFELGPELWSYGLGYYLMKPVDMAKLRARMDASPEEMARLTRRLSRQKEFALEGREYKRPRGPAPLKILEPWYLKKDFALSHEEKLSEELFSRELVDHLKRGFEFLIPGYRYFSTLDGDPDPRE